MKAYRYIFSFSFIILLSLPLLFSDPYGGKASERENRILAARPPIQDALRHPADYMFKFSNWISDNMGFREYLLRVYDLLTQKYFESTVQYTEGNLTYLIGENGHHFFAGMKERSLIPKFQGKAMLREEQLAKFLDKAKRIKKFLDDKRIPFLLMLCVDKETIYPEYYPKSIYRGSGAEQIDIITEYIKEHSNIDVFNVKRRFFLEKERYQLFNRAAGDLTHYNEIGAYFAYCELFEQLQHYFTELTPITMDDINIDYGENEIPAITLKMEPAYRKINTDFFDTLDLIRPFTWENAAFENKDSSKPTILFLRDSYTGEGHYFTRYIPEHFGRTILIHYSNLKIFDKLIKLYKPDIVVFESAERELPSFLTYCSSMPTEILE